MAPAGWYPIQPTGVAAAILGVSITFSILSTIVIALRVWTRVKMSMFSMEDSLMCIGYLINMVHNSVIAYGTFTGLGTPDSGIPNPLILMEGYKSIFLWQTFFLSGFVFIKCSICLTLLRIAVIRWHKITLWVLIAVTSVSSVFVTFYVLLQCRPIPAAWGEVEGTCADNTITVAITFVISALNLITDVTTAVLPFLMLRHVQMSRRKKRAVVAILSLGVLASVATIARLPFATAYFATTDYLVGIGHIILWTIIECDLALIAGSLPMLRALFNGLKERSTNKDRYAQSSELMTIGRSGNGHSTRGYLRHDYETGSEGKSESMRDIVVKHEQIIVREDRDPTLDQLEPSYNARTYV